MPNESLQNCRLYGILDLGYVARAAIASTARNMLAGGVDLLQLRAKSHPISEIEKMARELHAITREARVPLIINDHPEILRNVPAEGIHLGQDDLTSGEAREIVGREIIVGKSTHSLEQAIAAATEEIDYIGFGPLFETPTKPDYVPVGLEHIAEVHATVSLPIFCIGGIKLENLREVIAAGAQRVVIVSGLLQATDIAEYARAAKALLFDRSDF